MFAVGLLVLLAAQGKLANDQLMIRQIAASGRILELAVPPSERLSVRPQVAPGAPPLLSFRLFEEREHHRLRALDLVIDDAGH